MLLNASYRTIAEAADIALGNIGPLLSELQAQHLKKTGDKEVLQNKEMLIQRWTELYQVAMKPGLQLGMFRFLKRSLQQEWKAIHCRAFLGINSK